MFPVLRYPPLRPRLGALLLTLLTLPGAFAQTFVQKTGTDNPFQDLVAGLGTAVNVAPTLADFDGDGDLDLVAGFFNAQLRYFKNTGTPTAAIYTELTGTDSPFNGLTLPAGYLNPAAGDLNGDGKKDLVLGTNDGTFLYLKNTGTASVPAFIVQTGTDNPFNGIDVGTNSFPALADLDGDSLLDFVGRNSNETVHQYYKNTGTASAPAFTLQTGADDPFSGFGYRKPVLGDLNGDGTVDLLSVGDNSLLVIPNFGTPTVPNFATGSAFFIVQEFGSVLKGTLGDVNGDGRLDIVLGYYTGGFYLFEQVPLPPSITQNPTPTSATACVGGSASTTVAATGDAPLAYQWYRNQPDTDEPVGGQTNATLNLTNLQPADAGTYYARVSNAGGVKWSTAFTLAVSQPAATLGGTTGVCPGSPAVPVTFTGSGGTAPYTFTYRLNNGTDQTVTTTSGNSVSLNQATDAPGIFAYELVSVADANACTQAVSGQNATVTIQALDLSTAPAVAGAPVCAGQAVTVTFGVNCPGFAFTAELSDASGAFPGTGLGAVAPGGDEVVIPAWVSAGSGYRIRVVSTNPAVTSPPSAAFTVNALGAVALTTPTTAARACPGEALAVTFSTTGSCPFPEGNAFTVQLSNALGSFANPTLLGTAPVGTTPWPLPENLPAGTGYRVRIVSSLPAQTSAASLPFQLEGPSLSAPPTVGGAPVCRGGDLTVSFGLPAGSCAFPETNGFTAQLSSAFGSFNNPTSLGPVTPGQSTVTIPASVAAGSGYRIRVVSSSPALTSASGAPFQVRACANRLSAEEPQLVVAPNPVRGSEIRVRVSGMDDPAFSLATASGRVVGVSVKAKTDEFVLTPRQALSAGLYVVRASEGTLRLSQRVIVVE